MIEHSHLSDQDQLYDFPVVNRDHFHYSESLKFGKCGTSQPRKCVRGYSVLFDYYHRDLKSPLRHKERLKEWW